MTPAGVACLEDPRTERVETGPRRDRPTSDAPSAGEPADSKPESPSAPVQPVAAKISVPASLRGAHPFVLATRDAAVGLSPGGDGRIQIGPQPGVAYMVLACGNLNRALRVLQGVLREATRRGWGVVPYDRAGYDDHLGIAIDVRGYRYPVELHEVTETIPFTKDEITAWRTEWAWYTERRAGQMPPPQLKRKRATGRLRLSLPHGYRGGRANWTEGPRGSLDDKLPQVFKALEERADHDDFEAAEAARRAEEWRKESERRAEHERLARIEKARKGRLFAEAQAWHEVELARRYVSTLRNRLPDLPEPEQERLAAWCTWCEDWIAQNDPVADTDRIIGVDEPDAPR